MVSNQLNLNPRHSPNHPDPAGYTTSSRSVLEREPVVLVGPVEQETDTRRNQIVVVIESGMFRNNPVWWADMTRKKRMLGGMDLVVPMVLVGLA